MHIFWEIDQGSDLWRAVRKGRPTASNFDKIVTAVRCDASKSQQAYMRELIAESFCPENQDWMGNSHTDWGAEMEPEAREAFAVHTGLKVKKVGFVTRDDYRAGCSPDAFIVEDSDTPIAGLEIKCPTPKTHVYYVLDGILPTEYRQQVHGSMAITGLNTWHFWSFYPGLQPLHVVVNRDAYTEGLNEVLNRFLDDYAAAYAAALPQLQLPPAA